MWEQYKKTALGMQILIALVSGLTWYSSGHWEAGVFLCLVMQVAAVFGAAWGLRLRNKVLGAGTVPTRRT